MVEMIQINFISIIVCLLFVVFIVTNRSLDEYISGLFLGTSLLIITLIVVGALNEIEGQRNNPTHLRYILTSLDYILKLAVPVLIITIFFCSPKKANKKGLEDFVFDSFFRPCTCLRDQYI